MFEPPLHVSGGFGVIDMALLSVIRRWHFREHLSIREICRRTGLSRNTIRKYLRVDAVEPKFKVPERPSKLDPFADRLSAWLRTEAKKNRKQKRTMKQLHADLLNLGYEGSYGRVAAFARDWKADQQRELQTTGRGTFVPLAFDPGEAKPSAKPTSPSVTPTRRWMRCRSTPRACSRHFGMYCPRTPPSPWMRERYVFRRLTP